MTFLQRISPKPPRGVILRRFVKKTRHSNSVRRSRVGIVTGAIFVITSMATFSMFGWFLHSNNDLWVALLFAAVVQIACFCIVCARCC